MARQWETFVVKQAECGQFFYIKFAQSSLNYTVMTMPTWWTSAASSSMVMLYCPAQFFWINHLPTSPVSHPLLHLFEETGGSFNCSPICTSSASSNKRHSDRRLVTTTWLTWDVAAFARQTCWSTSEKWTCWYSFMLGVDTSTSVRGASRVWGSENPRCWLKEKHRIKAAFNKLSLLWNYFKKSVI